MISLLKYFFIFTFCLVLFSIPDKVYCLDELSKDEMKTTTGQRALTDFSITENTTRMFINTHIETYTEIESMKLGYYERNSVSGWDQNWTNLKFGNETENLTMDGFILKADFNDLNSSNPELKRLIIGTNRLNGTISGNFESFTGAYNPILTTDTTDDTTPVNIVTRQNLGQKEFNFDSTDSDKGFFLILSPDTANHSGIHSIMGYTEHNITEAFTNNNSNWWDSP
jgi:hypothetical protein